MDILSIIRNCNRCFVALLLPGITDLALNLKYGSSIKDTTLKVQEKVKAAIENMTGLTVADVNIRVAGVDMPEEE